MARSLDRTHLEILRRIERGAKIVPMLNVGGFRFNRGRTMWGSFLLEELRAARLLTADNEVTAEGALWLLVNSD